MHTQSSGGAAMSRLDDLVKLRADLLDWLDGAPADRKAALVAQYRATLTEIDRSEERRVGKECPV